MATPAVNRDSRISSSGKLLWYYYGVHYPNGDRNGTGETSRWIEQRPKSTSKPVRKDGTRAPTAWSNFWQRGVGSVRDITVETQGNGTLVGSYPVGRTDFIPNFLLSCGASWIDDPSRYPFPRGTENGARTRFLNAVSNQDMQLGASLGEFRETVTGVADLGVDVMRALSGIANAVGHTKRTIADELLGRPARGTRASKSFKQTGREIRRQWMAYQMGLKPTLSDIEDGTAVIDDAIAGGSRPAEVVYRKGFKTLTPNVQIVQPVDLNGGLVGSVSVEARCHIASRYLVADPGMVRLQQLGLTNPSVVAWELLQFSWMVDYMFSVGDWLNSFTAQQGLAFYEGTITRFLRVVDLDDFSFQSLRPTTTITGGEKLGFTFDTGLMRREVLSGPVTPALFPHYRNKLNMTRMANVLTALSQITGR